MKEIWDELRGSRRWIAPLAVGVILLMMMVIDVVRVLSRPVDSWGSAPRVELSAPELDGFKFSSGWSKMEEAGIWAEGLRSELSFRIAAPADAELQLVCRPYPDLAGEQILTLVLNRERLARFALLPGNRSYDIAVAKELLNAGRNHLELRYALCRDITATQDARRINRVLAVHFSRIVLVAEKNGQPLIIDHST